MDDFSLEKLRARRKETLESHGSQRNCREAVLNELPKHGEQLLTKTSDPLESEPISQDVPSRPTHQQHPEKATR